MIHTKSSAAFYFLMMIFISVLSLKSAGSSEVQSFEVAYTKPIMLIRNIHLIDPSSHKKDILANVLIVDYKVAIVSKDAIPVNDTMHIIDANKGYLLGQLKLGEPATFMVFSQDPRIHQHILLDTKEHAYLTFLQGVVLNNRYGAQSIDEIPEKDRKTPRGWLAYTPPPIALATNYADTRKWNRWESEYTNGVFIGALLIDRQKWGNQNQASKDLFGNLSGYSNGEIRAFRLGVMGTLNFEKKWVYTVFGATNAYSKGFNDDKDDSFTLFDYRLDIPMPQNTTLSIGKQKEPISMEKITSMVFLPMQERTSTSDGLLPSRNFGLVYSGTAYDQNFTWAASVFNDWFDTNQSFSDSDAQFVGRITGVAYESEDKYSLLHFGFGTRYSNGKEGYRFATEPEFNQAPLFVDTGTNLADSISTQQFEASYRTGPFWLHSEYIKNDIKTPSQNDPSFDGYHVSASWILTGQNRSYNRKAGIFNQAPISQNVDNGGWGTWETGVRWSNIDLNDKNIAGGDMDILSLSMNWWLTPSFNLNLNARKVWTTHLGEQTQSFGLNSRVMIVLQ